eukprot:Trichotokara_eunicae@DN9636_c0_g1_i1.p2
METHFYHGPGSLEKITRQPIPMADRQMLDGENLLGRFCGENPSLTMRRRVESRGLSSQVSRRSVQTDSPYKYDFRKSDFRKSNLRSYSARRSTQKLREHHNRPITVSSKKKKKKKKKKYSALI